MEQLVERVGEMLRVEKKLARFVAAYTDKQLVKMYEQVVVQTTDKLHREVFRYIVDELSSRHPRRWKRYQDYIQSGSQMDDNEPKTLRDFMLKE